MNKDIALIIGSSSGIGAGIAMYLAKNGFTPLVTYNKQQKRALHLVERLRDDASKSNCYHLDVIQESCIANLAEEISGHFNHIDLLICNAGTDYFHDTIMDISLHEWQEIFAIKVFGTYLCTKYFLPLLKKSKNPNIINISASLAERPDPSDPAYSSACAALNNLSVSLAKGLAKDKIRINVICPGPVDTNLQYWKNMKKIDPSIFSNFKKTNPLNLLTKPKDVGKLILSFYNNPLLTGNIVYVSGGSQLL